MSVQMEFERTFLARYVPVQIDGARSETIVDTYIPEGAEHASLRLRRQGERYELTKKQPASGTDSSAQTEHSVPLSAEEFKAIGKVSSKTVSKQRFYCTFFGHDAHVDVFSEAMDGLVLIDFEFESVEAMQAFQPPEVCLAEVTQDIITAGGTLAGKRYSDIDATLKQRYGYDPQYMDRQE